MIKAKLEILGNLSIFIAISYGINGIIAVKSRISKIYLQKRQIFTILLIISMSPRANSRTHISMVHYLFLDSEIRNFKLSKSYSLLMSKVYAKVRDQFVNNEQVVVNFGSRAQGIKYGKKFLIMFYKSELIVKLSPERVNELISRKQ